MAGAGFLLREPAASVYQEISKRKENMIERIMDKQSAEVCYAEIEKKLEIINPLVLGEFDPTPLEELYKKRILQGIMAGLVYFDENENCLVQKLAKPIQTGQIFHDSFKYKKKYKLKDACQSAAMGSKVFREVMAITCSLPYAVVDELCGFDYDLSMACLDFFSNSTAQ